MPLEHPEEHKQQNNGTQSNMHTVKAGQQKKVLP
ncbi:hypothetical protein ALON55S_04623 [Alishewanella longhuensis]